MKDILKGQVIRWTEPVWDSAYRPRSRWGRSRTPNPPNGTRTITGRVVKDSYGERAGQHTFTLEVLSAEGYRSAEVIERGTIRRKGRVLYRDCRLIQDIPNCAAVAAEKHERGAAARADRDARRSGYIDDLERKIAHGEI